MIDILFYDKEEACLVHDLCFFLIKEVADEINSLYVKDIEYLNHPRWSEVVDKAAAVYNENMVGQNAYICLTMNTMKIGTRDLKINC